MPAKKATTKTLKPKAPPSIRARIQALAKLTTIFAKTDTPKKLGGMIDRLYLMRAERLTYRKLVDDMSARESELSQKIIDEFPKSDIDSARGQLASASITQKVVPTVQDWQRLYDFIRRTGSWELLQRRTSDGAFRERWESGEKIPGVDQYHHNAISLRKR